MTDRKSMDAMKSGKDSVSVVKVDCDSVLSEKLLDFVRNCSWVEAKEHIAGLIESRTFTDWETMFAAIDGDHIVGMCSLLKTDYYPLPEIYPWVSCVFVTEEYRGRRISEKLIEYANGYAAENGFYRTYIPTEFTGLYEKYGYRFVHDIENYGGGIDRLLVKELG